MIIISRLTLLLLLICSPLSLFADTIWMKNGDRLTGKVSLLNNGKLVLDTNYAGSISISWSKVSTIETTDELIISFKQNHQEKTQRINPSTEGKMHLVNGDEQEVALQNIKQIIRPRALVEDMVWTGKATVSFDHKKAEKTTSDFGIDFKTQLQHNKWRHTWAGEYSKKSRDHKVSTDKYDGNYTLDHFITDKWFWQSNVEYKVNNIEDLYKQYTIGTGPGYQFWNNSLSSFSLAALANRSKYEYRERDNKNFSSAGIRWDYNRYIFGKDVEIFSSGDIFRPFSSRVAKYSLDANVGLRYKLTDWASLNMRLNRNKVDAPTDAGIDETRYIIGLGVNW